MSYEQIKVFLMPSTDYETSGRRFLAGSLAGCTSVFVSYPLDLLRVRLAFEIKSNTLSDVATIIYRESTPYFKLSSQSKWPILGLSNFYRGFVPTLYGMVPYAGVSFYVYDTVKIYLTNNYMEYTCTIDRKLRAWALLASGGISGMLAMTTSYPFEVIRRHMQVGGKMTTKILTTKEIAKDIWLRKGFRGFWVGLSIGYAKIVPMFALSFYTYEHMKKLLEI